MRSFLPYNIQAYFFMVVAFCAPNFLKDVFVIYLLIRSRLNLCWPVEFVRENCGTWTLYYCIITFTNELKWQCKYDRNNTNQFYVGLGPPSLEIWSSIVVGCWFYCTSLIRNISIILKMLHLFLNIISKYYPMWQTITNCHIRCWLLRMKFCYEYQTIDSVTRRMLSMLRIWNIDGTLNFTINICRRNFVHISINILIILGKMYYKVLLKTRKNIQICDYNGQPHLFQSIL